jgi:hypothetical protein
MPLALSALALMVVHDGSPCFLVKTETRAQLWWRISSRPFAGITRIRFKGFGLSAISDQTLVNLDTPRTPGEDGIDISMSSRQWQLFRTALERGVRPVKGRIFLLVGASASAPRAAHVHRIFSHHSSDTPTAPPQGCPHFLHEISATIWFAEHQYSSIRGPHGGYDAVRIA